MPVIQSSALSEPIHVQVGRHGRCRLHWSSAGHGHGKEDVEGVGRRRRMRDRSSETAEEVRDSLREQRRRDRCLQRGDDRRGAECANASGWRLEVSIMAEVDCSVRGKKTADTADAESGDDICTSLSVDCHPRIVSYKWVGIF